MKKMLKLNKWISHSMLVCLVVWGVLFSFQCHGAESGIKPSRIVIFVSKNIRPYIVAVDALRERLDETIGVDVEVIMLDRYTDKARSDLTEHFVKKDEPDLVAAIGTEAAVFVEASFQEAVFPKLYSIILNPEKVINDIESANYIPLNIPPPDQLRMICQGLSEVKRIGIFYDPAYNSDFYAQAADSVLELDVELVPMKVSSKKDIPFILEECWDSIDCVWLIPDRTVTSDSESIAQHIIKQAVLKKVPVVGYNRFFYDSGAAMSFVFDYAELGRQTADLAADILQLRAPGALSPVFKVWLNESVFEKIEIKFPQPIQSPMMVGP
jgi:putative ABC transport system substrate-binding protein